MKVLSKNYLYIYIVLWMIYSLQDMLMIKGIIAQLIFVFLMVFSFYSFCQINLYYKIGPYIKWLNFLLLVITIYGLIPIIGNDSYHKNGYASSVVYGYVYLQKIYLSVLPVYTFIYYFKKNRISSISINFVFFFLLICTILMYYQNFFHATARLDREEITNNVGYKFVPLILMLYIVKIRMFWKYVLLVTIFSYIMMSMKRGAILVGSIAMLSFLVYHLRRASTKQIAYFIGLSTIAIYMVYRLIMNLYTNSRHFNVRLERTLEGNSSHRDEIYRHYLDYFLGMSTPMEFFFGHGAAGTVSLFGQWAHNDWLEFAINQGLLGVMLYCVYWCVFIYEWWNYHGPREYQRALRDCIIVYFLVAIFSMSFNNMPLAASLCIGYCLAMNQRDNYKLCA